MIKIACSANQKISVAISSFLICLTKVENVYNKIIASLKLGRLSRLAQASPSLLRTGLYSIIEMIYGENNNCANKRGRSMEELQ